MEDFQNQLSSLDKVLNVNFDDVVNMINKIGYYIVTSLDKIKDVHCDIYTNFLLKITTFDENYVGTIELMDIDNFYFKCKNNMLTINNIENVMNMLWCFIKFIVSDIIFIGVTSQENENYEKFKSNINNGILYLKLFMNFDENKLHILICECFSKMEIMYSDIKTINKNQFYKYVVRLSLLEARIISDGQRSNPNPNLNLNKKHENYEIDQINLQKYTTKFKKNIGSLNTETNYYKFVTINDIYSVCGLSGSTFECMMYTLIFNIVDQSYQNEIISNMILFELFHLTRGSHSDLEIVCAFEKISKYYSCFDNLLKNVVNCNYIVFNKGKLSENLFFGYTFEENKLRYRIE